MSAVDKALETQISNIETRLGASRDVLIARIREKGLAKHGETVAWLKADWGLGHGDANTLAHMAKQAGEAPAGDADPLATIYTGAKAGQRPIHDALMAHISAFGPFEVAPKKGYVSLRRARQFAMLGPKTNTRFELGVNLKDAVAHPLAKTLPPGGMCQHVFSLTDGGDVDEAMIAVVRAAYDAAG